MSNGYPLGATVVLVPRSQASGDFDPQALFAALDRQREERGLSWTGAAREIWEMSAVLNQQRPGDHPIAAATLRNVARNDDTSCQHALFFCRWLDRSPESFVPGPDRAGTPLPAAGPDRRLRWDLKALHAALDARRRDEGLTWTALAEELSCRSNQLTGLRTARFATSMRLAMRCCRWLGRPAADFVYLARW